MAKPPYLHIGWQHNLIGVAPPGIPVYLNAAGLKSHTAIIAQSGSGKSFMLGRLLEEIAAKTRARIVILDPDSDFVKFSEVNVYAWSPPQLLPWFAQQDTAAVFHTGWGALGFQLLTNRDPASLGLAHANVSASLLSVSWGRLSLAQQSGYLGFSMQTNPGEIYLINKIADFARNCEKESRNNGWLTLARFVQCAEVLWCRASRMEPNPYEWAENIDFSHGEVSPVAAMNVYGRAFELRDLDIWDRAPPRQCLPASISLLGQEDSPKSILSLAP